MRFQTRFLVTNAMLLFLTVTVRSADHYHLDEMKKRNEIARLWNKAQINMKNRRTPQILQESGMVLEGFDDTPRKQASKDSDSGDDKMPVNLYNAVDAKWQRMSPEKKTKQLWKLIRMVQAETPSRVGNFIEGYMLNKKVQLTLDPEEFKKLVKALRENKMFNEAWEKRDNKFP